MLHDEVDRTRRPIPPVLSTNVITAARYVTPLELRNTGVHMGKGVGIRICFFFIFRVLGSLLFFNLLGAFLALTF
jgi:hypothetical protein